MKKLFTSISILACLSSHSQVINVSTSNDLQYALVNAKPGHIITLKANTTYSIADCNNKTYCVYNNGSGFKVPIGVNGTKYNPIKLVGPRSAVITSANIASKYGIHLQGNDYWVLEGFTVTKSSKCVMLDSSSHNIINNLRITQSGYEALHLRKFSSYNTVSNCYIDSTGMDATASSKGYAEGIYVGTANSNWIDFSNNQVDTCNFNIMTGNTFGGLIKSENIDIKEGTFGGEISNNIFNGLGCNGNNSADKYVDIKGDNYVIKCNTGANNSARIVNGFEVNINKITTKNGLVVNKNFGDYNTFSNNTLNMTGTTGTAIFVNSYSGVIHNTVCSNNVAINAAAGLCNLATVSCSTSSCGVVTNIESLGSNITENIIATPNPFQSTLTLNIEGTYSIYSLSGMLIEKGSCKGNCEIGNSLSPNVYLLEVLKDGQINRIKVVKQ